MPDVELATVLGLPSLLVATSDRSGKKCSFIYDEAFVDWMPHVNNNCISYPVIYCNAL